MDHPASFINAGTYSKISMLGLENYNNRANIANNNVIIISFCTSTIYYTFAAC